MMGCLTMSGSSARVVGPLLLAKVYSEEGPQVTFILFTCFAFLWWWHSTEEWYHILCMKQKYNQLVYKGPWTTKACMSM